MSRKLKMLQLCAVGFTVEKLLLPLIDGMSEYYDVTISMTYDSTTDRLRAKGYHIENVNIDRKISPVRNIKTVIDLYRLMKREQYDVVHVHTPVAGILGRLAAKLAGVKVIIYTAHGFYFHDNMSSLKKNLFVLVEKLGGRLSDYIFTQSYEDYQTAIDKKIISKDKILAIGNGVDITRFSMENIDAAKVKNLKDTLGIADDETVVGIVGRVVKEKGYLEWVQAACKVLDKCSKVKFIAIGDTLESDRDGIKPELDQFIRQNEMENNVLFLGSRSDIPELLAIMDIFTLPSYREGMPRSIIEAMSMGKPVIATNIRGCREEVVEEQTGFLIPVGDADSLAEKIMDLIINPEKQTAFGINARKRAEAFFDEKMVIKAQVDTINRLCQLI